MKDESTHLPMVPIGARKLNAINEYLLRYSDSRTFLEFNLSNKDIFCGPQRSNLPPLRGQTTNFNII